MNDDVKRLRTPQRPPFDAELAEALTQVRDEMPVTVTSSGIGAIRERAARTTASVEELAAEYGVAVRIVTATRHGGPNLRLLVARPPTPTSGALYWIHGGGGVLGDFRFGIDPALTWAAEFGVTVVSVDYRLAPEHRDPVAIEDCYAGLCWLASNARTLQVDPTGIIVGGHSAGAGLAAGTALLARDRGGPRAHGQLLLCPMLDDREQTVSSRLLAGEGVWDRTANRTAWAARLGARRGGPTVSAYSAPARAGDLGGLPPAFLDVGSVDTFRDETVEYASRIWSDGGEAELHVWPGAYHCFEIVAPAATLSTAAVRCRAGWLRRRLEAS
ncbi:alpha/beta hydrolase domain-containing protein [Pseudonocardia dioxanivorans CB1190]|uniref:Alpha/beta hydrolase domain-containing protein n=1 Tax=Pseudonocardia dioxanivorans (strain ATCC 55486 / DSM 44775 / JCM 13855 / CB1190) TaxID=675635 RepID=F4CPC7_PSEUX|nr:alpha/beta hydrolase [Pseudonocardia dioxanivorans]AEA24042.1 alpha/beta hydrolase domain-containing protein [Pseudonocardia dioxanivorans CB1190]